MPKRKFTDEQLVFLVAKCFSVSEVCRSIGYTTTSSYTRQTVNKYIERLGLDTSHFISNPRKRKSEDIYVEHSTYPVSKLKSRLIADGLKEHRCEICNNTKWMGSQIPLDTHHKNGISDDHRLKNLELICPNCHAQTDNYKSKNKGKAKRRR